MTNSQPTLHVIAPFHTIVSKEFSHCAFTGKALRFAKMMQPFGYRVVEYSNPGSQSLANVKVPVLNTEEFHRFFKPEHSSPGAQANVNSEGYRVFNSRLPELLKSHAMPGDIVCQTFGPACHPDIVKQFTKLIHVESGIGYPVTPFGCHQIFESEAWRHYQWGRFGTPGGVLPESITGVRTFIAPNYFDVQDWPVAQVAQTDPPYVVFMGRFVVDKGIEMLARIVKTWAQIHPESPMRFVFAGMGDFWGWCARHQFNERERSLIDYRGVVIGDERGKLLSGATAMLMPTIFVEPFGGSGVEAQLCGVPLIAPTFGAFTETTEPYLRCESVDDYCAAIVRCQNHSLSSRRIIREKTDIQYSLEAVGNTYDKIFRSLASATP
ncbi:MAG: glycosyltransferase [Pseudomonadota bacterium]